MKIVTVVDAFFPYRGGGQIWVWETAKRLVQKYNCEVEVVTRSIIVNGKTLQSEFYFNKKLKITRLGKPSTWNNILSRLLFVIKAVFYLLPKQFDLIDAQAFIGGIPGKIIAILKRRPVIFTVHGTTSSLGEKLILTNIKYDAEITVSKNFLKARNFNKEIFVINPGTEISSHGQRKAKNEKNIVFVGRLQRIKGTENILKIAEKLQAEKIKLTIVGDGPEKKRMQKIIGQKHLANVNLIGAITDPKEYYQSASLFFLPSLSEGFPLTVLEAMSHGLPVVGTKVGDMELIVRSGENGFLFEKNDIEGMISGIKLILGDSDLWQKISQNNYQKAQNYSWDTTADKIFKVYEKIYSSRLKSRKYKSI